MGRRPAATVSRRGADSLLLASRSQSPVTMDRRDALVSADETDPERTQLLLPPSIAARSGADFRSQPPGSMDRRRALASRAAEAEEEEEE